MLRTLQCAGRRLPVLFCAAVLAVSACPQGGNRSSGASSAPAPVTSGSNGVNPGVNVGVNRSLWSDFPSGDPNFSHRQLVARREDLKKHMVENAARLLVLTRDLQTDLLTREATDADAKRLDEIAKLARTVRDQMRQ